MESKRCPDCKRDLPLDEWQRASRNKDGLQNYCRTCLNDRMRAQRAGLTLSDLREMLAQPDRKCEICSSTERLVPDHCHTSKKYRGWLCNHCNLILGHAKDNPEVLLAAAEYLRSRTPVP
jgi:hypothetical protein